MPDDAGGRANRVHLSLTGETGAAIRDMAERATGPGPDRALRLGRAMRAVAHDCLAAGLEAVQVQRGVRRPRLAGTASEQAEVDTADEDDDLEAALRNFDPGAGAG